MPAHPPLGVRHLANQNAAIVIGGATPTATTSGSEGLEAGGLRLIALEQHALQASISERTLAHWGRASLRERFAAVRVRHAGGNVGKARLRPEQWLGYPRIW